MPDEVPIGRKILRRLFQKASLKAEVRVRTRLLDSPNLDVEAYRTNMRMKERCHMIAEEWMSLVHEFKAIKNGEKFRTPSLSSMKKIIKKIELICLLKGDGWQFNSPVDIKALIKEVKKAKEELEYYLSKKEQRMFEEAAKYKELMDELIKLNEGMDAQLKGLMKQLVDFFDEICKTEAARLKAKLEYLAVLNTEIKGLRERLKTINTELEQIDGKLPKIKVRITDLEQQKDKNIVAAESEAKVFFVTLGLAAPQTEFYQARYQKALHDESQPVKTGEYLASQTFDVPVHEIPKEPGALESNKVLLMELKQKCAAFAEGSNNIKTLNATSQDLQEAKQEETRLKDRKQELTVEKQDVVEQIESHELEKKQLEESIDQTKKDVIADQHEAEPEEAKESMDL